MEQEKQKRRVVAYIDWFNLYHSIDKNLDDSYKWINYRKMVETYLWPEDELIDIFLFSANPHWKKDMYKHKNFMDVQYLQWIRIKNGNYSEVSRYFDADKMKIINPYNKTILNINVSPKTFYFKTYEEKQTDVNISLHILEWAFKDYYDKALIFSWDSDIAPSIIMAKQHFPEKNFTAILPINGKWRVISRSCDKTKILSNTVLQKCKLPNCIPWKIRCSDYSEIIFNPYL